MVYKSIPAQLTSGPTKDGSKLSSFQTELIYDMIHSGELSTTEIERAGRVEMKLLPRG